jgi:hypothetical protein
MLGVKANMEHHNCHSQAGNPLPDPMNFGVRDSFQEAIQFEPMIVFKILAISSVVEIKLPTVRTQLLLYTPIQGYKG